MNWNNNPTFGYLVERDGDHYVVTHQDDPVSWHETRAEAEAATRAYETEGSSDADV